MIRVLHYVGKMDRGGMETLIMNLYRNIDRTEIQFDFAVHGTRNGDFEEEILQLGGKFYQFPHMRQNPRAYRKAWRAFWAENGKSYRAFHMHTNSLANLIAMEEACRAGVPIRIIHSHSSFANRGRLQWLNNSLHKAHRKKLKKLATQLISCSDKAAAWMYGGMQLDGKQVLLLRNGVDIDRFSFSEEKRKMIRMEWNLAADTFLVGQIGAFLPVKNHGFSLEFFRQLQTLHPNSRLVLVGDGALKPEITRKIQEMGLDEAVILAGKRSDVDCVLSALDLYIMPSLYEGLPVSLVEAQVNGVPALVSDTITQEVHFNENLVYLSISDGCEPWVACAQAAMGQTHQANLDKVRRQGFDIQDAAAVYVRLLGETQK